MNDMENHICILITIIFLVGILAGSCSFLNYYFRELTKSNFEVIKYILSGIGAATLVPLLLNMLSSNLIKYATDFDKINYFVFAGFCFIAGYFSDRFISTISDKVLKDLEKTKEKVKQTNDRGDRAISSVNQNEAKIDFIVESESDSDEDEDNLNLENLNIESKSPDDDIKTQTNNILATFSGKYKFRSAKGIAKQLTYSVTLVEIILDQLESMGVVKKLLGKDSKAFYGITKVGTMMAEKNKK